MLLDNPFIHTFRTREGYYFYDVNRNSIIKVVKGVYYTIKNNCEEGTVENNDLLSIVKMKEEGLFSSKIVKKILHPANDTLLYYLNNKLKMLTLQVTRQCNLRCEYCVYSGNYENRGHSNERMSFTTAKKGIDFLLDHSRDSKNIAIGFYGGEPLLEFELIKKCIEYAEKQCEGKELLFTFTTNATLFNDEILEYIKEHNIRILVSLDGPGEVHDINRKFASNCRGTFDIVIKNLQIIKDKYPEVYNKLNIHAVVDRKNEFGCINSFFADNKVVKDASFSLSFVSEYYSKRATTSEENFIKDIDYEYFKLFLNKLGKLDKKYISKLVTPYFEHMERTYKQLVPVSELSDKMHHGGPCIPGVQRLFLNVNGEFFPCERVNEESYVMNIGNIDDGFDIEKVRSILNIGKISEEECKTCWAIRFCGLCAAAADNVTEFSSKKKAGYCNNTKNSIESMFKDICTLREKGFNFSDVQIENDLLSEV